MAYDKGTPTRPVKIAPGIYSIDSFRNETESYRVDLNNGTCTCKHFTGRLVGTGEVCKHVVACRAARFEGLIEKAKALPSAELEALLPKYEGQGQLDIAVAIRAEIQARQQAAVKDADLRRIFA
jgi:predicted nucleic acid-binding Zn finger protein